MWKNNRHGSERNRAEQLIDADGFRPNVGLIIANDDGRVLWARRRGQDSWQFPQGGIKGEESAQQAVYRELDEEVGLTPADVKLIGRTRGWLRYRLPRHLRRHRQSPVCVGQKQVWFLLRLITDQHRIRLDRSPHPEFDTWMWLDYWDAVRHVVFFKRRVYERALTQLAPLLFPDGDPAQPFGGQPASRRG